MLGIARLLGVMAGGTMAYFATRFPPYVEAMETVAGILVIGGFALATYAIPALI